MPFHNCATCESKGDCLIEDIAPWINEHEDEVLEGIRACSSKLAGAGRYYAECFPPACLAEKQLAHLIQTTFLVAYHKGRTYQDVPQVFKDMG